MKVFSRTVALIFLTGCQSETTAAEVSADFAIACVGKASFSGSPTKDAPTRTYDLPPQTYVFNEKSEKVWRALEPRQEFEELCFREGYIDTRDFSPGLISVTSERPGARCDFSVNRKTGEGTYFSAEDMPNGSTIVIEFDMMCKPAEIPVFDQSENQF